MTDFVALKAAARFAYGLHRAVKGAWPLPDWHSTRTVALRAHGAHIPLPRCFGDPVRAVLPDPLHPIPVLVQFWTNRPSTPDEGSNPDGRYAALDADKNRRPRSWIHGL